MDNSRLDFARRRRHISIQSLVWLLIAGTVCTAAGMEYWSAWQAKQRVDEREAQLSTRWRMATASQLPKAAPSMTEAQIDAINQAITQMNLPWEKMFRVFEKSLPDDVALLGLDPDGSKRILRITAEAKTADDVAVFLETLTDNPIFANVTLVKHEINEKDPNLPIRFRIDAEWRSDL